VRVHSHARAHAAALTHMGAHAHTHTHVRTHTCTHTHTHSHTHMCKHTHARARTHVEYAGFRKRQQYGRRGQDRGPDGVHLCGATHALRATRGHGASALPGPLGACWRRGAGERGRVAALRVRPLARLFIHLYIYPLFNSFPAPLHARS